MSNRENALDFDLGDEFVDDRRQTWVLTEISHADFGERLVLHWERAGHKEAR